MDYEADYDGGQRTGSGEQLARLLGFLLSLGAMFFLWLLVVAFMFTLVYAGELRLIAVWAALFAISPLLTVAVYAFGWLRDWSVVRCVAASLAGAGAVGATVSVIFVAFGGELV